VNMNIPEAQNYIYKNTTEPIIALIHDDVNILEKDWDLRVLREFEDSSVGMVGFAAQHVTALQTSTRRPTSCRTLAAQDLLQTCSTGSSTVGTSLERGMLPFMMGSLYSYGARFSTRSAASL